MSIIHFFYLNYSKLTKDQNLCIRIGRFYKHLEHIDYLHLAYCWRVLTQGQVWGVKGQRVDWLQWWVSRTHWTMPRSCRVHTQTHTQTHARTHTHTHAHTHTQTSTRTHTSADVNITQSVWRRCVCVVCGYSGRQTASLRAQTHTYLTACLPWGELLRATV